MSPHVPDPPQKRHSVCVEKDPFLVPTRRRPTVRQSSNRVILPAGGGRGALALAAGGSSGGSSKCLGLGPARLSPPRA